MSLPQTPSTIDLTGQLVFLGTGTSVGVPVLGCDCETCRSTKPRNHRTRCGLVVGLPEGTLLVDTPYRPADTACCGKESDWPMRPCSRTVMPTTSSAWTICDCFLITCSASCRFTARKRSKIGFGGRLIMPFRVKSRTFRGSISPTGGATDYACPLRIAGGSDHSHSFTPRFAAGAWISFWQRGLLHRHE